MHAIVLALTVTVYIVARSQLPPEMAASADYTVGLQQLANFPQDTRVLIDLGKVCHIVT